MKKWRDKRRAPMSGEECAAARVHRLRVLAALAGITLLAACSGSDDSTSDTTETAVETTAAVQAEDVTTTSEAAEPEPEATGPLTVADATLVGPAADTNGLNGIFVSPVDGTVFVASVGGGSTSADPSREPFC